MRDREVSRVRLEVVRVVSCCSTSRGRGRGRRVGCCCCWFVKVLCCRGCVCVDDVEEGRVLLWRTWCLGWFCRAGIGPEAGPEELRDRVGVASASSRSWLRLEA